MSEDENAGPLLHPTKLITNKQLVRNSICAD